MKLEKLNIPLIIFAIAFFLEGLDAFSIANIPLSWIGVLTYVLIFIYLKLTKKIKYIFDITFIKYFLYYLIFVTIIRAITFDLNMPEYATTSLVEYIGLRLLKILSFYTIISLTVNFVRKKNIDYVIKLIAYIGVFISLLSLYSYFSYIFDWTDFSRTRAGTGGWTQPIRRACSILRNYGTFREPSFLAVWLAPVIPLIFYLARKSKVWYIISLIPILSLVLTRSLTGIISIIIVFSIALLLDFYKTKKFNFLLVVPILLILVTSLFGNNFGYKFPALDPSMCPPESADKCDCSIYDDDQDIAKNSSNVFESVFSRISIIASGGIGGFENIETLNQYIKNSNFKIFGDGLGFSNIQYSPEFAEITKQTKDGQTIYRNPGQVVSFNNLYANLYFSGGIISLLMFLGEPSVLKEHLYVQDQKMATCLKMKRLAERTSSARYQCAKVKAVVATMREKGIPQVLDTLTARWVTDDFAANHPDVIEKRRQQVIDTPADIFLNVFDIYAGTERGPWLPEISAPCQLVTGEEDGGCNPRLNREMANALPNAELVILDRLKHAIFLEATDQVLPVVRNFLIENSG